MAIVIGERLPAQISGRLAFGAGLRRGQNIRRAQLEEQQRQQQQITFRAEQAGLDRQLRVGLLERQNELSEMAADAKLERIKNLDEFKFTEQQKREIERLENAMGAIDLDPDLSEEEKQIAKARVRQQQAGIKPLKRILPKEPPPLEERIRTDIKGFEGLPIIDDPVKGPRVLPGFKPPVEPKVREADPLKIAAAKQKIRDRRSRQSKSDLSAAASNLKAKGIDAEKITNEQLLEEADRVKNLRIQQETGFNPVGLFQLVKTGNLDAATSVVIALDNDIDIQNYIALLDQTIKPDGLNSPEGRAQLAKLEQAFGQL